MYVANLMCLLILHSPTVDSFYENVMLHIIGSGQAELCWRDDELLGHFLEKSVRIVQRKPSCGRSWLASTRNVIWFWESEDKLFYYIYHDFQVANLIIWRSLSKNLTMGHSFLVSSVRLASPWSSNRHSYWEMFLKMLVLPIIDLGFASLLIVRCISLCMFRWMLLMFRLLKGLISFSLSSWTMILQQAGQS